MWLTTTSRSAPTGIVEVASVLDAEVLRHGDLHGRDVVPVPDRLEHRVREPQVEDLAEAHLPEEVVDPVELRLVDGLVQLVGQRPGGGLIVAEGLLHDDASCLRQAGLGEALDDPRRRGRAGSRGRRRASRLPRSPWPRGRTSPRPRSRPARRRVGPRSGRTPPRVELLAGALDRLASALAQLVDRPVVDRHARRSGSRGGRASPAGTASGRSSPSPGRR